MAKMLEELQLAVCSLGQDGGTEGFHDLFDSNGLASELIFCRAACIGEHVAEIVIDRIVLYHTNPKAPIPTGCRSVYLLTD